MKKACSAVLAAVLLLWGLGGCSLPVREVSSELTTVVTQSRTPVENLTVCLPKTAPAGLAQILEAYSQSCGAAVENLSAESAALVYIEDYNAFLQTGAENAFYNLSQYPSQTVLALCDTVNTCYAIQAQDESHYALPVGLEGFGYMVNTRILGDIFEQELPEEL
ncbi:MAG: hypothetical protein PHG02_05525, partial [Oscillospiraceae bacterium]|nr:hypothetical protein [Oscillospiraceae bacterium]